MVIKMNMQNVRLRNSIFGGYKKKDVIYCLEKIQSECEELRKQTEEQVSVVQKEYAELENKYQNLLLQNSKLQKECDDFNENKNLLVQLEIEANARAVEKVQIADKKAAQVVRKAHVDAATLREQYILKAREELLEIKKVQVQLAALTSTIASKNKIVHAQICSLEKIIHGDETNGNGDM